LGNASWLYADRLLRMAVGLFVGVWLARYLGPAVFGQYSYAYTLAALFGAVATLGLDRIVVRELVNMPEAKHEWLGSALALRLFGGVLAGSAMVVSVILLRPEDTLTQILVAVLATGLVVQSLDVLDLWFQSQLQGRLSVLAKGAAFVIATAAKIMLILAGAPVLAFVIVGVVELLLGGAALAVAYALSGQTFARWRVSATRAAKLMKPALPLLFSGIAISVYMKIDQIMLGQMLGDEAVGVYSAAVRLSEATYFIPAVMVSSILPAIHVSRASNRDLFLERMQRFFDLMTVISLTVALPISLLSSLLIEFLYGPAYAAASGVLAVYAWSGMLVFLGVAGGAYLVAEDLNVLSLYRTLLGAVANVGLNLMFIPKWGMLGAAYATLISYAIVTYAILLHPKSREAGVMLLKALLPIRLFREWGRS
jgi:polysaccharide transporter, PST family